MKNYCYWIENESYILTAVESLINLSIKDKCIDSSTKDVRFREIEKDTHIEILLEIDNDGVASVECKDRGIFQRSEDIYEKSHIANYANNYINDVEIRASADGKISMCQSYWGDIKIGD